MSESLVKDMTEDQNSWVLDSLVGFLKGPVWNLSIQAFIEQKSVVFDPDDQSEQVDHEYRLLYEEYKHLVDRLLSSHMSDLEISAEQFDDACRRADGLLAAKFKQILFEEIWAANDYQIFVRFMTQRNIELQLQALEVLAQRFGLVYESFLPLGSNKDDYLNDEMVINEAINRSLAENEAFDDWSEESDEKKTNEEKIKEMSCESREKVLEEKSRLEMERMKEQEKLNLAIHSLLTLEDNSLLEERDERGEREGKELPKLKEDLIEKRRENHEKYKEKKEIKVEINSNEENNELMNEKPKTSVKEENENSEEIRKRSEYLRKQRDKILKIKKEERNKQISKLEEQELLAKRPKSARTLRSVTEEKTTEEESDGDQSLAFRRSLAARLKAEVIEQQKH